MSFPVGTDWPLALIIGRKRLEPCSAAMLGSPPHALHWKSLKQGVPLGQFFCGSQYYYHQLAMIVRLQKDCAAVDRRQQSVLGANDALDCVAAFLQRMCGKIALKDGSRATGGE